MITASDLVALAMLGSLILYCVLGGADFGGGIWDLFASGSRAVEQRRLIAQAIAPIWEANHVWLILVVVMLFTAFPAAYATATIALHIPLSLMLLGIVLRGSAFVFRQYSAESADEERRWGRVFAVASIATPMFLGVTLGAVTSGALRIVDGLPSGGFFASWARPFSFAVGLFTTALFAFLAAVYLTNETEDPSLRDDFRRRALLAQGALLVAAIALRLLAENGAPSFAAVLGHSRDSLVLHLVLAAVTLAATTTLLSRRYRAARVFAIAEAVLILLVWARGQHPYLIAPDLTIAAAAAPARTLHLLIGALAGGALILFPSLVWLFRVFKASRR